MNWPEHLRVVGMIVNVPAGLFSDRIERRIHVGRFGIPLIISPLLAIAALVVSLKQ
jgi:hypothetical protein